MRQKGDIDKWREVVQNQKKAVFRLRNWCTKNDIC
jgi:hypothetical protein